MIYELRLYAIARSRMADQHARFAGHLPPLFRRHAVPCVGAWTAMAGAATPRFVYLLAYRDYAEREAVWGSFFADADWPRVRDETNGGHEFVERHDLFFLKPNVAWQADQAVIDRSPGVIHELEMQQVMLGQGPATGKFLADSYLPCLREAGAQTLGVFDVASGVGLPKLVMLHAWPDANAWRRGRQAMEASARLSQAFSGQRKTLGNSLFGHAEVNLLEPLAGVEIAPGLGRTQ